MLRMTEDIDMGADLQRLIGLRNIRREAAAAMVTLERTPIYAGVVRDLGVPPLGGAA